jgi:hypothetical protein
MGMAKVRDPAKAPVDSLVVVPVGNKDLPVILVEDRGRLAAGRRLVRVKLPIPIEAPEETEVPAEALKEILWQPGDPPEARTWAEKLGEFWVGTYTDFNGRLAIVTKKMKTKEQAKRAAARWVRDAEQDGSDQAYAWQPHPQYPWRYAVYRQSRLGPKLVLAPA